MSSLPAEDLEVKEEPAEEGEIREKRSGVVLDSISEYCRGLGEMPTYGRAGNREDLVDLDELAEVARELESAK